MDPQGLMQLLQMLHAGGFGSKTPQGQLPAPNTMPGGPPVASPTFPPQGGAPGGGGMNPMALGGLLPMLMGGQGGGANGAPLAGAGLGGLAGMLMGGR